MRKNKIAVIGRQVPDFPYNSSMGYRVGYKISKILEEGDILLTGGVEGVGLDTFIGYCANKEPKGKFGVIIPENIEVTVDKKSKLLPFRLPEAYRTVSEINNVEIDIIQSGLDMFERRQKLAEMSDVAIVLNGGAGTLDEAAFILQYNKPLIVLPSTGGVAEILMQAKNGTPDWRILFGYRYTIKNVYIPKILNKHMIFPCSFDSLEETLKNVLKEQLTEVE